MGAAFRGGGRNCVFEVGAGWPSRATPRQVASSSSSLSTMGRKSFRTVPPSSEVAQTMSSERVHADVRDAQRFNAGRFALDGVQLAETSRSALAELASLRAGPQIA